MQPQSNASADRPVGLTVSHIAVPQPEIRACSPWSVTNVEVAPDSPYRLRVDFQDGVSGIVDMSRLIFSPGAGVFAPLADAGLFSQVCILHGAVTWPGEIPDLAPDAMHRVITEHGEWIP